MRDKVSNALPFLVGSCEINQPVSHVLNWDVVSHLIHGQGEGQPYSVASGDIKATFDPDTNVVHATIGFMFPISDVHIQLYPDSQTVKIIHFDPPPTQFEVNYLTEFGFFNKEFESSLGLTPPASSNRPDFSAYGVDTTDGQAMVDHVSDWIREHFYTDRVDNLKSGNKIKREETPNDLARRSLADREIGRSRDVGAHNSDAIEELRAHNCEELSHLSTHFFRKMGIDAICVRFGKAHVVCAISASGSVNANALKKSTSHWPDDIFICDVWANIKCQANEYPEKFTEKMEKWGYRKMVANGFDTERANSERWMRKVLRGKPTCYRLGGEQ